MTRSFEYRQKQNPTRRGFWLRIHENKDSGFTTIWAANEMTKEAISIRYPSLEQCDARRGWQPAKTGSGYSLRIPDFLMDWGAYEKLKEWADIAGNQCIWLSTNGNTENLFQGNELDFCVAYDWNYDFSSNSRTRLGEAEYQMKYRPSAGNELIYGNKLKDAIETCCACLPYDCRANNFVVTAIPATVLAQNKLAWRLAERVAQTLQVPMIPLTLDNKPDMKNLTTAEQRVREWRSILSNWDCSPVSGYFEGANVLIIDDLYQSGASVWCLAEYLKSRLNANVVQAAVVVKSVSDG